uniref:Uncharacterized protein n=1 Tax=viral metagenome TaxID=1070528 RepID=A0A6M3K1N4_9ZZZZ
MDKGRHNCQSCFWMNSATHDRGWCYMFNKRMYHCWQWKSEKERVDWRRILSDEVEIVALKEKENENENQMP